jgi:hypothetical protein
VASEMSPQPLTIKTHKKHHGPLLKVVVIKSDIQEQYKRGRTKSSHDRTGQREDDIGQAGLRGQRHPDLRLRRVDRGGSRAGAEEGDTRGEARHIQGPAA